MFLRARSKPYRIRSMGPLSFSTAVITSLGDAPVSPQYSDALKYLNSLQTDHATLEERRRNPPADLKVNDALDEMFTWVHDLGYQPSDFDRINPVHVAGTKGKGTTCAFVNSILLQYQKRYQSPKKVGLYTSPHLLSVCERIRINSKPISEEKFTKYFFEVWTGLNNGAKQRGGDPRFKPAYFRYLTLMSFHAFLQEKVDVAVYEVGVGGEFDSTNVISTPAVVGITSLGIDHVQVLGKTIEEIAWHKAGIMKFGSPAYTVWQPPGAMQALKQRAVEKQVQLSEVPIEERLNGVGIKPDEDFQKRNASLAIVLATKVLERLDLPGLQVPGVQAGTSGVRLDQALPPLFKAGLTTTIWRGRGESIKKPYGTWFLDGAHTAESLAIVADWFGRTIKAAKKERGEDPLCILVFNQQADTRDARQLVETVQSRLSQWGVRPQEAIFCSNITYRTQQYKLDFVDANTNPDMVRRLSVQRQYAEWWTEHDSQASTHVLPSIEEVVDLVRQLGETSARPVYILGTGSFRLVGGVLNLLEGESIATEASTTSS